MNKSKILITGASGCVGQYISSWLIDNSDAEIYLWLRNPRKLKAIDPNNPRVKLLVGDIRQPELYANELSLVTHVIHTATAWGNPQRALEVNIIAVKNLLNHLNPNVIEQIIYFSTASILTRDLIPINQAIYYGTEYIQTKAKCLQELKDHSLVEKIISVFPTLVFGGEVEGLSDFPTSYLTSGLSDAVKWLWLARWFKAYSRFHFIHAKDIAFICGKLATNSSIFKSFTFNGKLRQLVLAQPSISIDHAIDTLLKWKGMRNTPRIPLWGWVLEVLVRILPLQLSPWDRLSIKQRHFEHSPITNPETIGGESFAKTINEIISNSGISR